MTNAGGRTNAWYPDPPGSGLQTFTTTAAPPGTGRPSFTHPSTQDPGLSIYVPYLRTRQQLGSG